MGVTVRQKVNGKGNPWHVFIHVNGIIRSKAVGEKRDADAVASAIRRKLALGEFAIQNFNGEEPAKRAMPTFAEFADRFMKEYASVALKKNTQDGYQWVLKLHLLPAWGERKLDSITRADVKTLILAKQNSFAQGTVQNIQIVTSSIFTFALEDEVLTSHPAQRMGKFIRKGDKKKDVRPLTREQAAAFLEGARTHFPEHFPLFLCAFRTGMRFGELLGLKWEDVDYSANRIEIKRSFSHGRMDTPKSKKSRFVDMSNQLKLVLMQHRGAMQQKYGTVPEAIFPGPDGGHADGDNFRNRVFYKLMEKLDFPSFRIHDIRHTFASHLLANAAPIVYVKEQMGHASIQTTVDIYGHLVPGSNRNEVNRLDDAEFGAVAAVKAAG